MAKVVVYASAGCMYCAGAKSLFEDKGVDFDEIRVDKMRGMRQEMEQRTGKTSVPQIFIDDAHVGGFDDLSALDKAGDLDTLLRA